MVVLAIGHLAAWAAGPGLDLTEFAPAIADSITTAIWAVGSALAQWILTVPKVNDWLIFFVPGLAAAPKKEVDTAQ